MLRIYRKTDKGLHGFIFIVVQKFFPLFGLISSLPSLSVGCYEGSDPVVVEWTGKGFKGRLDRTPGQPDVFNV